MEKTLVKSPHTIIIIIQINSFTIPYKYSSILRKIWSNCLGVSEINNIGNQTPRINIKGAATPRRKVWGRVDEKSRKYSISVNRITKLQLLVLEGPIWAEKKNIFINEKCISLPCFFSCSFDWETKNNCICQNECCLRKHFIVKLL
jgi:hypothetical protein